MDAPWGIHGPCLLLSQTYIGVRRVDGFQRGLFFSKMRFAGGDLVEDLGECAGQRKPFS